jgi:hypothetical protein
MSLNVIHGILIGVVVCATSIHLNVLLGVSPNYFVCTTQYLYIGSFGYIGYWLIHKIYAFIRKKEQQSATEGK